MRGVCVCACYYIHALFIPGLWKIFQAQSSIFKSSVWIAKQDIFQKFLPCSGQNKFVCFCLKYSDAPQMASRSLLPTQYFQITWLEGHSLAQTVFTCLYIHNPDFIEDPAMKAFALGILKICDIAREKVNKAAVFEEVSFFLV